MGKVCYICGKYGAIRRNITHDNRAAMKADDVIAQELECGHIVGNEKYQKYEEERKKILADAIKAKAEIDNNASSKLASLHKTFIESQGGA